MRLVKHLGHCPIITICRRCFVKLDITSAVLNDSDCSKYSITLYSCIQVMESEEFMLLPANQLIDIISSDELNVRSEEQVFNAVMAWVKYSIQERRPQLPQVIFRLSSYMNSLLKGPLLNKHLHT